MAGSLTVTPAALTITADNQSKVYGAALPTLTDSYNGFVSGDTAASLSTAPMNSTAATAASHVAGNPYAITASGAADSDYAISYVAGALTVTPAALTITADNQTKVYGAALPTLTDSYSGFVNGDTAASLSTAPMNTTTATAASHVSGNPYAITASGGADSDYAISYVAGALTVTPEPITFTAAANTKTYDGTTSAAATPTVTFGTLYDAATLSETYASKNAGTGLTLTPMVSIANAGDYTVTLAASHNGVIDPKGLSATATAANKTYDGTTTDTGSATLGSGVVSGDNVGLTAGTYAFTDKNAGSNKTVDVSGVTLTGADASNYTLSIPATVMASIFQKAIAATVTANSKTYDGTTTDTGSASLGAGEVAGDSLGLSAGTYAFTDKNAGTGKTVTVSGVALTGADAGNYLLTVPTTTLADIFQKALTLSLTGTVEKTYDGSTTATLSAADTSLPGVIAGDSVSASLGAANYDTAHAGTGKTVTTTGDGLTGADAANYNLTSTTASAAVGVIDPRSVTITADNESKLFGQTDPVLSYAVTSGSIVAGDQTVGALTRTPGQAPGAYAIDQGTLGLSSDYALSFNPGVLSIEPVATEGSIAGIIPDIGGFTRTDGLAPGYTQQNAYSVLQTVFGPAAYTPGGSAVDCADPKNCAKLPYPTNREVAPGIRFVSGS